MIRTRGHGGGALERKPIYEKIGIPMHTHNGKSE
jgi:hypothetical protein